MSLSKRIHQVKRNIASAPQFSIGDESMKDKLEDLNKKMVKLAILLQKQKNGIAKIEQPHIIEGSISRHEELLSKETGLVRSQLENVLQQKSKKLSNRQKSQERIKSYEYNLSFQLMSGELG